MSREQIPTLATGGWEAPDATPSTDAPEAGRAGSALPRPCLVVVTGLVQKVLGSKVDAVRAMLPDFELEVLTLSRASIGAMGSVEYPTATEAAGFLQNLRATKPWLGFLGASAGGFGALRHGVVCGADVVIGLSAFTTFDEDAAKWDWRVWRQRHHVFAGEPDNAKRNIRYFMEQTGYARPIHLFFPKKNGFDARQADNLAIYPNCTLHPQVAMQSHVMHGAEVGAGGEPKAFWKDIVAILRGNVAASPARNLLHAPLPAAQPEQSPSNGR